MPSVGSAFRGRAIKQEEISALIEKNEELEALVVELQSQIAWLKKQLFGSKSEKLDPAQPEFDLEGTEGKRPAPPEDDQEEQTDEVGPQEEPKSKEKRPRRTKDEIYNLSNLPVKVINEVIPEEVLANPERYKKIAEETHDALDYRPGRVQIARTLLPKYIKIDDKSLPPVQAPAPLPVVPGTMITAALGAHIVVSKHGYHVPHYRIAQIMNAEQNMQVLDRTINKWGNAVAEHLAPIVEAIKADLMLSDAIQMDETPIKYLKKGTKKSQTGYIWVMRDPLTEAAVFHWDTSRSTEALQEMLGYNSETNTIAFRGSLQCDGYKAYTSLKDRFDGIELGGCFAHVRRYFLENETMLHLSWVRKILGHIQELYKIEKKLKKEEAEKGRCLARVKRVRQEESSPITQKIHSILIEQSNNYRPSDPETTALNYTLGQWESLLLYLEDPKLDIDNNAVERLIRPTKIGAKNYLFFGNAEAGTNNAIVYTLIANCKALGIDARAYLEHAITQIHHVAPESLTPAAYKASLEDSIQQAA